MPDPLPRGIWYEKNRNRYRVKLYRNNISYFGGYYKTPDAAIQAYEELKKFLSTIPKLRRGERQEKEVFGDSMKDLISSSKQENDPTSFNE